MVTNNMEYSYLIYRKNDSQLVIGDHRQEFPPGIPQGQMQPSSQSQLSPPSHGECTWTKLGGEGLTFVTTPERGLY